MEKKTTKNIYNGNPSVFGASPKFLGTETRDANGKLIGETSPDGGGWGRLGWWSGKNKPNPSDKIIEHLAWRVPAHFLMLGVAICSNRLEAVIGTGLLITADYVQSIYRALR